MTMQLETLALLTSICSPVTSILVFAAIVIMHRRAGR